MPCNDSSDPRAVNDRFATAFQESGIATAAMMPLASLVASVQALGIDLAEVVVMGTVFTTDEGDKVIAAALPGNQEPANVCLRTGKHISDCDEAELCAHCDGSKKGC